MKIAIVTSITPNKKNTGGPSGLIWEIQEYLKQDEALEIRTVVINLSKNKYIKQLQTWGVFFNKCHYDFSKYDKIIIYPDFLLGYLPKEVYDKIIVLAPDASSMVAARKYKLYKKNNRRFFIKKIYQCMYLKNYIRFERKYIPLVNKYIVVGINDRRWLKCHLNKKDKLKVKFLRHPLLSYSMTNLLNNEYSKCYKKRFIFSGDMRYSYVGVNIDLLARELSNILSKENRNIDIVVVGKNNKWVADILKKQKELNVKYYKWIEKYQDICRIGQDVHCIPLMAGGGTKNRVLTALANGLEVISTPIGTENIPIKNLTHVFVCKNMKIFAKKMIEQSVVMLNENDIKNMIKERLFFRDCITKEFKQKIKSFL